MDDSIGPPTERSSKPECDDPLDRALNLKLQVIAVLADRDMTLEEVLSLKKDALISFEKPNSEPLDFYVSDRRVGAGRAIKIGDKFGIWVDEIDSPKETIEKLG